MRWFWIIVSFVLGLGLGLSVISSTSTQSASTGNAGLVISIVGLGVTVWNLYRMWSSEIRLSFGQVAKHPNNHYYLTIKNVKGNGMAIDAEAHLTLKGVFDYSPTVWADSERRYKSIGRQEDLFLFRLEESNKIFFKAAKEEKGSIENDYPYDKYLTNALKVQIDFKNGSFRQDYKKTLSEIVRDAKRI